MRVFKAVLVVLLIPAIISIINVFQDYADDNMTLNTWEDIILRLAPFVVIGLVLFGIIKAVSKLGGGDKGGDE